MVHGKWKWEGYNERGTGSACFVCLKQPLFFMLLVVLMCFFFCSYFFWGASCVLFVWEKKPGGYTDAPPPFLFLRGVLFVGFFSLFFLFLLEGLEFAGAFFLLIFGG